MLRIHKVMFSRILYCSSCYNCEQKDPAQRTIYKAKKSPLVRYLQLLPAQINRYVCMAISPDTPRCVPRIILGEAPRRYHFMDWEVKGWPPIYCTTNNWFRQGAAILRRFKLWSWWYRWCWWYWIFGYHFMAANLLPCNQQLIRTRHLWAFQTRWIFGHGDIGNEWW